MFSAGVGEGHSPFLFMVFSKHFSRFPKELKAKRKHVTGN